MLGQLTNGVNDIISEELWAGCCAFLAQVHIMGEV